MQIDASLFFCFFSWFHNFCIPTLFTLTFVFLWQISTVRCYHLHVTNQWGKWVAFSQDSFYTLSLSPCLFLLPMLAASNPPLPFCLLLHPSRPDQRQRCSRVYRSQGARLCCVKLLSLVDACSRPTASLQAAQLYLTVVLIN